MLPNMLCYCITSPCSLSSPRRLRSNSLTLRSTEAKGKYLFEESKNVEKESSSFILKKSAAAAAASGGGGKGFQQDSTRESACKSPLHVAIQTYMRSLGFQHFNASDWLEDLTEDKVKRLVDEREIESYLMNLVPDVKQRHALATMLNNYGRSGALPSFSETQYNLVRRASTGDLDALKVVLENAIDYIGCACYVGYRALVNVILYDNEMFRLFGCIPLMYKFDLNAPLQKGLTCLMWAAIGGHEHVVELLLSKNVHIDIEDGSGMTAFLFSCMRGHTGIAKMLLKFGANLHHLCNHQKTEEYSALYFACSGRHVELVKILISAGADVDFIDHEKCSLLMLACMSNNLEIAKYLVDSGCNVNQKQNDGYSALFLACSKGYKSMVKFLLENGADPNEIDTEGGTSLMLACISDSFDTVQMLIEHGAFINMCDFIGVTSLMLACDGGYTDIVRLLLSHNVQINLVISDGWTALMLACSGAYVDIVNLLIDNGADVDTADLEGYTVLMAACGGGNVEIVKRLLSTSKVNVNVQDSNGRSALLIACHGGYIDMMKLLLDHKADVNMPDIHGSTPLMTATVKVHPFMVNLLLDYKADTNACDEDGSTALMIACKTGNTHNVLSLIFKEADVNVRRKDGKNAMTFACRSCHASVIEALVKYSATFNARATGGYPSSLSDVCDANVSERQQVECINFILKCHAEHPGDGGVAVGIFSNEDLLAARYVAANVRRQDESLCAAFDATPISGNYKITLADLGEYEGDWLNNKRHGKGVLRLTSGTLYEGEFFEDVIHGFGTKTWGLSKSVYSGSWDHGKRTGRGVFTYANGMKHDGEFLNDNAHGIGLRTWANGSYFTGEFANDKCLCGQVFLVSENMKPYIGYFSGGDDIVDGFRVYDDLKLVAPNGSVHRTGPFSNGFYLSSTNYLTNIAKIVRNSGESTLVDVVFSGNVDRLRFMLAQGGISDEDILAARFAAIHGSAPTVGVALQFKHSDINGHFSVVLPNCGVYTGAWKNSKRHGFGVLKYQNGDMYEGNWSNDCMHGEGTMVETALIGSSISAVYKGSWVDNKRCGKGLYTYANGLVHEGDFANNKAHGRGRRTFTNSSYFVGEFEQDKCIRGKLFLVEENFKPYSAVFAGGDAIVGGYRLYDDCKLSEVDSGQLYKSGPFSNGEMISQSKYVAKRKKING